MSDIKLSYNDSLLISYLYEEVDKARLVKDNNQIRYLRNEYMSLQATYEHISGDMWILDSKFIEDHIDTVSNFRVANLMYYSCTEDQRVFIKMKWGKEIIMAEQNNQHG